MLTKLSLYQFKKFQKEHFDFLPLTLLTGVNGMGKSSVIQALLILRQSYDRADLQSYQRLTIKDKDLADVVSPDDMLCADATSTEVSIGIVDDQNFSGDWTVKAEGLSNTLPLIKVQINGDYPQANLFQDTFQYLNAERLGPRQFYERLTVARPHSLLGYRGEFTASALLNAATKLDKVETKTLHLKGYEPTVYDLASAWISEILYPGTKVGLDDSDPSKVSLQYTFEGEKNRAFNPLNVGFGFSFALPIIVAVLTAKPGSLIIVENPEAHLHPRGQSAMGRFLALAAQGGLQVLTETHSDHILNGIRIVVKNGDITRDKVKIMFLGAQTIKDNKISYKAEPQIDENGKVTEWPRDFFDTWEYSMMELL